MTDQNKTTSAPVTNTVAQKLWQLRVFLDAAGFHDQSAIAFAAIQQLQVSVTAVEPWCYYADCSDPDYSCLCNNAADAQTEVNDHGGTAVKLWNVAPDFHVAPLRAEIAAQQRLFTTSEARNAGERQRLEDAYETGYGAGQNNPNGYSNEADRDLVISLLLAQSAPATEPCAFPGYPPVPEDRKLPATDEQGAGS